MRKNLSARQLHIKQIFRRIRELYFFANDSQLASHFGLSDSWASKHVSRGTIPWSLVEKVSEEHDVALDWIVHGKHLLTQLSLSDVELEIKKSLTTARLYKLVSDDATEEAIKLLILNSIKQLNFETESKVKEKITAYK